MVLINFLYALDPTLDRHFPDENEQVDLVSENSFKSNTDSNKTVSGHDVLSMGISQDLEAQESINWLAYQIRRFFYETHFDVDGFVVSSDKLGKDIADLDALVSGISPFRWNLKTQVVFLQRLFERMAYFADNFGDHPSVSGSAVHLLYRMAELSVSVYGLCDSYGNLDTSIQNYQEKLFSMWDMVAPWTKMFATISRTSMVIQNAFHGYRQFVEDMFEFLWSQSTEI